MTLATPSGPLGPGPSLVELPVSVEHELEALHAAMEHARQGPMSFDDMELEFETFLAAVTTFPTPFAQPELRRAS
jgi:hypothetical protein